MNGTEDKQDDKHSKSRILTSYLPLVFACGKPMSLENLDLAELRRFFRLVLDCEREARQSDFVMDDSKPVWWPEGLPLTEDLWESQTKRGYWCSVLRKAIKACYDHHDSGHLLEFSGRLMQYVESVSNVKLVDNSDGTRTLINADKGRLLATFKYENQDYDKCEEELAKSRQELAKSKEESAKLKLELAKSKQEMAKSKQELSIFQQELAKSQKDSAKSKQELTLSKQDSAKLQQELIKAKQNCNESKQELAKLKQESAKLQEEFMKIKQKLTKLKQMKLPTSQPTGQHAVQSGGQLTGLVRALPAGLARVQPTVQFGDLPTGQIMSVNAYGIEISVRHEST